MMAQEPICSSGGIVRITYSSFFRASKTIAAALVEVEPRGMHELQWHPNTDEWQYYMSARARVTVFSVKNNAHTFNFQAADVGSVSVAMGHSIKNIGDTKLRFGGVNT